jgi:hypothetical protein
MNEGWVFHWHARAELFAFSQVGTLVIMNDMKKNLTYEGEIVDKRTCKLTGEPCILVRWSFGQVEAMYANDLRVHVHIEDY